jgi:hypothetical protein
MAKRSNFKRRKQDAYLTIDPNAVKALAPHLGRVRSFAEPCAGEGHLVRQLEAIGLTCRMFGDIATGQDALQLANVHGAQAIISNTPWTRAILHPMILHFQKLAPTWLLFDSDWAYTKQAIPYLARCSDIVAVGRLRWIEGTKSTGKDNVSWYRFWWGHAGDPRFHGRRA